MTRAVVFIAIAGVTGFAMVYFLPPSWLGPLASAAFVCFAIFAVVVRFKTKKELHGNPIAGALLSIINLPEQPLTKVKEGWALTTFFALAVFLISLALAVVVRANF